MLRWTAILLLLLTPAMAPAQDATTPLPEATRTAPTRQRPPPPPPPGKGASFRLERGDARLDIKCADEEPMAACVEAVGKLLDRVGVPPGR